MNLRANRPVQRHEEVWEFREMPGQQEEWAGSCEMELSPLWRWLGLYPIYGWVIMTMLMIGAAR